MPKEKEFYVGISNPMGVRRDVLETSKEIIQILKRYETFSHIKENKRAEMARFRTIINDITQLMTGLKSSLPPLKLEDLPREEASHVKRPVMAKVSKPQEKVRSVSEIDRLEQELGKIEEKLRSL